MSDTNIRARLLRACYSFMVPVARFLLRSGIGFSEFAEISRAAFVEVASGDYGLRGRPTNISRIAAMTGIGRKEVRRLRKQAAERLEGPSVDLNPLGDVLHHWFTDDEYLGANGRPRSLAMQGGRASFERLAKTYAGDIPAGAVKVELIRLGSVMEDSRGRLHAVSRQMIPSALEEKVATSLSFGLRSLAETVAFNSAADNLGAIGRFERMSLSHGLTEKAIGILRPILREQASVLVESVDNLVSGADRLRTGRRVGMGVYYYEED